MWKHWFWTSHVSCSFGCEHTVQHHGPSSLHALIALMESVVHLELASLFCGQLDFHDGYSLTSQLGCQLHLTSRTTQYLIHSTRLIWPGTWCHHYVENVWLYSACHLSEAYNILTIISELQEWISSNRLKLNQAKPNTFALQNLFHQSCPKWVTMHKLSFTPAHLTTVTPS